MKMLEEMITSKGQVYPGNILKVDGFLNHQVDVELVDKMAEEFYGHFKDSGITKVLTIEASGIAIGYAVAKLFKVPLIFAKKSKSLNLGDDVYVSRVSSFTRGEDYDVTVSRKYLDNTDKVLLIDDFIAIGNAMKGLVEICDQARACIAGIGVGIEKGFQPGGEDLRMMGFEVLSLAIIDSMSEDGTITFRKIED
jgi:xanthine phosphoribosyltransferase